MVGNPSPQVTTLPTGIKHFGDDDELIIVLQNISLTSQNQPDHFSLDFMKLFE